MSKESRKAFADQSRVHTTFGEPGRQNRWTVFFRAVLVIPHSFVLAFRSIVVEFLLLVGWFCALITGRLPTRIASYLARYIQYATRVQAYSWLLLDRYPPFSLDNDDYPVSVEINPVRLSRLSVLFRFVLLLPASMLSGLVAAGFEVAAFFIWLIVLILGQMPPALFDASAATLRFLTRCNGYALMVSRAYPGELLGDAGGITTSPSPTTSALDLAYPAPPIAAGIGLPLETPPTAALPESPSDPEDETPPAAPYSGGPRYAFSEPATPTQSSPYAPTPSPVSSPWSFGPSTQVAEVTRSSFVLSTAAKRVVVLFVVLGVLYFAGYASVVIVAVHDVGVSRAQALGDAEAIGFQAADFPTGTQANYGGAGAVEFPSAPGLCSPVSSKPWSADVFSANYSLASNSAGPYAESTDSNVVIMPSAADATNGLDAIEAPGYAMSCFKPADDKSVPAAYTGSAACGPLEFEGSSIVKIQAPNLGVPTIAYRYIANMACPRQGTTFLIFYDSVSAVVGTAFIQANFLESNTAPTPAQERHYMSIMTSRAPADLTGRNSGVLALGGANSPLRRA